MKRLKVMAIRALNTAAYTVLGMLGAAQFFYEVNWVKLLSAAGFAG